MFTLLKGKSFSEKWHYPTKNLGFLKYRYVLISYFKWSRMAFVLPDFCGCFGKAIENAWETIDISFTEIKYLHLLIL